MALSSARLSARTMTHGARGLRVPARALRCARAVLQMDQLHESLEADYELGCVIKDKIIPRAVAWVTGAVIAISPPLRSFAKI